MTLSFFSKPFPQNTRIVFQRARLLSQLMNKQIHLRECFSLWICEVVPQAGSRSCNDIIDRLNVLMRTEHTEKQLEASSDMLPSEEFADEELPNKET